MSTIAARKESTTTAQTGGSASGSAGAPAGTPASTTAARPASADKKATRGQVDINNVRKSFGATEVLKGVSLSVPPGGVAVIVGPSGSGKSTLLRTINHLEKVDGGYITIDGELVGYEVRGNKLHELREKDILKQRTHIGMVFQSFNLFPHLTALENVIEAPIVAQKRSKAEARKRGLELLDRVGLKDRAEAYPRQLSGGQQQRVAIARALALDPKILLFDEPTSALDPELVNEVLDVIRELAKSGTTLIVVTHEMGFARDVADTVVFMDQGQIVESGTPQEIFANPREERTRSFFSKVIEPAFNI
ncbi:ectoine/hydroxyectoine ABC transporter ATP-binding protein EhuA [Paenarthrobacter nitroguajacolicus]|uniref:amino acid ABC transporter ATP-binding protein n=1 Tax=Paenarthrobacter nitroguajacolicus TaxID=211146 RepID=UPI001C4C36F6|nr:amino acid ABC transporter ATP-binding protein [Paenarthrobacter nitroguajacolicus]NWL12386.1 ectoine/hydroxyectoine ABC transporter ATP-binding protein EhuA [Paenarthrobacter nitroguajacolicus]